MEIVDSVDIRETCGQGGHKETCVHVHGQCRHTRKLVDFSKIVDSVEPRKKFKSGNICIILEFFFLSCLQPLQIMENIPFPEIYWRGNIIIMTTNIGPPPQKCWNIEVKIWLKYVKNILSYQRILRGKDNSNRWWQKIKGNSSVCRNKRILLESPTPLYPHTYILTYFHIMIKGPLKWDFHPLVFSSSSLFLSEVPLNAFLANFHGVLKLLNLLPAPGSRSEGIFRRGLTVLYFIFRP